MKNSISRPVQVILFAGVALLAALLWFKFHSPRPAGIQTAAGTNAEPVAASRPASPAPDAGVAAPAAAVPNGDGWPAVIPIPLAPVLIAEENSTWLRDTNYLLAPHSPQEFGGVEFLMDGMIQLQGQVSRDNRNRRYRTAVVIPLARTNVADGRVEIVQRGSNVGCLHLLGASRYSTTPEQTMANVLWHYTDGTTRSTPVQYQIQIRDWTRHSYEQPAHLPYAFSKVVWTVPQASPPDSAFRLYRVSLANPQPKKVVRAIELASTMMDPTLFVVGLTLDPLRPGERPDSTPDLEPADALPPGVVEILVQNRDGQPVPQAKLQIQYRQHAGRNLNRSTMAVNTGANGAATVSYPPQNLDQLRVTASHDDYGGREMMWDLKAGDTVPASYTIKLVAGVNIGGTVVDEGDLPVAGASLSFYRFWSGGDEMNQKGEQSDFANQTRTTDAQGTWQLKGLPADLLSHIGFDVKHPDFLGVNHSVGENSATESQLRAGTMKIVLHRGLDVPGRVTDDQDNPISGATVWVGEKYSRERQQTRTDAAGQFSFHNVAGGDVSFSASAGGRQPESRTVTVQAGMAEIVFKLAAGKTIRAVVQDESAAPIPGVRVVLEGNGGIGNTYEFTAETDKDGRFTWDAAPGDPVQFYFGKEGYQAKRNVTLAPGQDNTVTLHHNGQLQGLVLDADTGQPVTKFSVRVGQRTVPGQDNIYGVIQNQQFTAPDGKFTMDLDEENNNAVEISSDDYSLKVESFSVAPDGNALVTVRLKPSASLRGVVVAPEGTPLPGVSVAITKPGPGGGVSLQGTHLRSWGSGAKVSVTDADGKFTLGSPPETGGTVVAVGDLGFTAAPVEQVRANPAIILQPYGRIEGSLKIGGQPGAGKDLYFTLGDLGVNTDFNGYKTTTDDQGKFTFDKVPPGEGAIVRLIQTSPNSWTHSDSTTVNVAPGATTSVTLGDHGAVIFGSVRFAVPPTNGDALQIEGRLSGQMPSPPAFNSPAEARAYYQSPEWRALQKQFKNYTVEMKPDGSFMADDVAPGAYSLNVSARKGGSQSWSHPPVAQGSAQTVVPDSFDPASPINVGEILLQPVAP